MSKFLSTRIHGFIIIAIVSSVFLQAQEPGLPDELFSRPERTKYQETSVHADIMAFVQSLEENSDKVHVEIMGTSFEGRDLPLVIISNPKVTSPEQAFTSGKPVFYIQGNIHGGEVEGKEAILKLLREIAFEQKGYLLDNQILLFCPLFNPDGNDDLGPNNRPNQDGSPFLAGKRTNGQYFDLNRDGLKLETFEGKALVENVMNRWDPLMFVDLHTTNGTWHGYSITYAPGIHTAGHPAVSTYLNEELFPRITNRIRQRSGHETHQYGGFYEYPPQSYYGMYPEPRFLTNSFALKNKLAILVETFSHDHFEKRIDSNIAFLTALLEYTNDYGFEIQELVDNANQEVIDQIIDNGGSFSRGVEFSYEEPGLSTDLYVYEVKSGKRTGKKIWYSGVNQYFDMSADREAIVPRAYVFPEELWKVAEKLREHGVLVTQLSDASSFQGEKYTVMQLNKQNRSYQGHYPASLEGYFENASLDMPAGSYFVDMAQAYAFLIFYMLEPEADDGLVHWNYFDDYLEDRGVGANRVDFPVFKIGELGSGMNEEIISSMGVSYNPDQKAILIRDLPESVNQGVIELVSSSGQIMIRRKLAKGETHLELNVSSIALGLYLIRLSGDNLMQTQKVLIRNLE